MRTLFAAGALVLALFIGAVAASALYATYPWKAKPEDRRPLSERLHEQMVKRCKRLAPKDQESRCAETQDSRALHAVMVDQVVSLIPANGTCTKHGGQFLICTGRLMDGTETRVIYSLSDADDGSDNQIMSVWSQVYVP